MELHSTYSDGYRLNDLRFRSWQGQETILQIIQPGSWAHLAANAMTTHLHPVPGIRIIAPIPAHSVYTFMTCVEAVFTLYNPNFT